MTIPIGQKSLQWGSGFWNGIGQKLITANPEFSHCLVARSLRRRPDKACDRGPRRRTNRYVEQGRPSETQAGRMDEAPQ